MSLVTKLVKLIPVSPAHLFLGPLDKEKHAELGQGAVDLEYLLEARSLAGDRVCLFLGLPSEEIKNPDRVLVRKRGWERFEDNGAVRYRCLDEYQRPIQVYTPRQTLSPDRMESLVTNSWKTCTREIRSHILGDEFFNIRYECIEDPVTGRGGNYCALPRNGR